MPAGTGMAAGAGAGRTIPARRSWLSRAADRPRNGSRTDTDGKPIGSDAAARYRSEEGSSAPAQGKRPMSRTNATRLLSVAVLALMASAPGLALDQLRLDAAVQANLALFSTDDIVEERFASRASATDLDGDGVEEILFLATARCVGANFDCPNELVVLAAAAHESAETGKRVEPDVLAAARTGYRLAAAEQIPGDVHAIRVRNGTIEVAFQVEQDSPICKRSFSTEKGRQATTHCPPPGRHEWLYRWSGTKLVKVSS